MPEETEKRPSRRGFMLAAGGSVAAADAQVTEKTAKKRIGIGLIGCGGRGSHLAEVVGAVARGGDDVQVVAVCDAYQPRLERAGARLKAKEHAKASALIADPAVDAVIVATPDRLHVYHALEAVRAGKDVYCEKPLTHWSQFDKLKELVHEVRRRKAIVQVGAQWSSDPIWSRAAEQIRSGRLGKIVHAQTGYFRHGDDGERGMPIDDPGAQPGRGLDWEAFQSDAPKRPFTASRFFQWRLYADYSGGPVTDLYPHPLTRLLKAIGVGMPRRVVAAGGQFVYKGERDVPDTFDLLIEYPEGPTVSVLGTICNDTGMDTVIRGFRGTYTFTGDSGLSFAPQPGVDLRRGVIANDTSEQDHMRNFLNSIRTRQAPACDIELGYKVQVPLIMAMQSYMAGKVAFFDAEKEEIRLS